MNKIEEIINAIDLLTDNNKLHWIKIPDYLSRNDNMKLSSYIIEYNKYLYMIQNHLIIECYESYCAEYKNGLIFMFYMKENNSNNFGYILAVQNTEYSNIFEINEFDTYQEFLTSIALKMRTEIDDNYSGFLDGIINDAKKCKIK